MKLYRNIKLSTKALMLNPSRTIFSILGMAVGIAAVIVTVAIGEGAKRKTLEPIEAMGTNVLLVNSGKVKEVFGRKKQMSQVVSMKPVDVELLSEISGVELISGFQEQGLIIKYNDISTRTLVQGVASSYSRIRGYKIKNGRTFLKSETENSEKVAIVGADVARLFFKNVNPIGEVIKINKIPFTVIGVLQPKGLSSELGNIDNVVMVPVKTAMRRLFNLDYLSKIYIEIDDLDNMTLIEKDISEILRITHQLKENESDYTLINQVNEIRAAEETANGFNNLTLGVAIVSLIIGGVGILAVMLLSVKERINEIGLRKSIGAKTNNIVVQFLSEAVLIGVFGGIIGVVLGVVSAILLNSLSDWSTFISIKAITASFGFSIVTALIFGVFPARQAARLDPIEALKEES